MLATYFLLSASAFGLAPSRLPPRAASTTTRAARPRCGAVGSASQSVLPTAPKDVAEGLSVAISAALAVGERQLHITLPPNMRFGIFGDPGKVTIGSPDSPPTVAELQRAEFELAYLVAETFRGECTLVLESQAAVKAAEREFARKGLPTRPRLVSSLSKAYKGGGGGFGGAAGGAAGGDAGRVVAVLRPSAAQLKKAVCPEGGAVLLLNPQAPPPARFAPTYVLLDNPHPDWQGGLLFRAFPGDWALAAAGFGGALTVHGRAAERPSLPDIDRGFQAVRDDNNPFSRAVGAAAALRRRGEPDEAE